jgi:hypothetical protein
MASHLVAVVQQVIVVDPKLFFSDSGTHPEDYIIIF